MPPRSVNLLDWGEDGFAPETETATLRASFEQEVAVWRELKHQNVTKLQFTLKISAGLWGVQRSSKGKSSKGKYEGEDWTNSKKLRTGAGSKTAPWRSRTLRLSSRRKRGIPSTKIQ